MFKLTYKQLRDSDFLNGMNKLTQCAGYKDPKVSYNIMRMGKALETELRNSQAAWIKLADPLIQRDEKNNFKASPAGFAWKDGVNVEDAEKIIQQFLDTEIAIDRLKLSVDDIGPAMLSPAQIGALEPMLTEFKLQAAH